MNRRTFFTILACCFWINLEAQVPASLDPNWELNSNTTDYFSGTSLDSNKWDNCADIPIGWGYGNQSVADHVIVSNGFLRLKLSQGPSLRHVGQIRSVNPDFSFGYYEISSKVLDPGYYDNGVPWAKGIWPTFWMYYQGDPTYLPCYHDEIDIVETLYKDSLDTYTMESNILDKIPESSNPNCQQITEGKVFENGYIHDDPLFEDTLKYAAEWLPDRIIFYFEDQPVATYFGSGIPQHAQWVVLAMQTNSEWVDYDESITLPQYMLVDYFKHYELIDDSGTDEIVSTY